jgi:hypothetical protein
MYMIQDTTHDDSPIDRLSLLSKWYMGSTYQEVNVHIKALSEMNLTQQNKLVVLIDTGSALSVVGENTEAQFAAVAKTHGRVIKYFARDAPVRLKGVGAGYSQCDSTALIPIAVNYVDKPQSDATFSANVATGSGADLPAILGTTSMRNLGAIIILTKGKEQLVIPGKGGFEITWSAGTKILPLVTQDSGHIVVPCDQFGVQQGKTCTESFYSDCRTDM